jgi:CheY-like chemotaxis protein
MMLNVSLDDDNICISTDPDRMEQVVGNLLTNAIKFTPEGGTIGVQVRRVEQPDAKYVWLIVADTGQGIEASFLPFVFDRFRQADSSSTRRHGGLGIGLAVVRHIVEQHGGRVWAESGGLGHGATFTVELPAAEPVEANLVIRPASNPEAAEAARLIAGLRVLLVDDDLDTRELIASALRRAGAEVAAVPSAAEALNTLQACQPDILLSDIAMPVQDGYCLIRQIRRLSPANGGEVPAIALSASASKEDSARAVAAGFQFHLAKPVDPGELLERIAYFCRRKQPSAVTSTPQ